MQEVFHQQSEGDNLIDLSRTCSAFCVIGVRVIPLWLKQSLRDVFLNTETTIDTPERRKLGGKTSLLSQYVLESYIPQSLRNYAKAVRV